MKRKIIQITSVFVNNKVVIHGLCDDGTVWVLEGLNWIQLCDISQE